MMSRTFSGHWRQLSRAEKVQMGCFLFCIFAWAWAPLVRFAGVLAGFNERPWYSLELLEMLLLGFSFAGFLLAMRGKGSLGNRILVSYERSWAKRKAAESSAAITKNST